MKHDAAKSWAPAELNALMRTYQGAAVLAAAAELDVFSRLAGGPSTVQALAKRMTCDLRGLTILLDALVALRLLVKKGACYSLCPGVAEVFTPGGACTCLGMAQHQANCMRRWGQLASVVKTGRPAKRIPSVRGAAGDRESFIAAMNNTSAPVAAAVVRRVSGRPGSTSCSISAGLRAPGQSLSFAHARPRRLSSSICRPSFRWPTAS